MTDPKPHTHVLVDVDAIEHMLKTDSFPDDEEWADATAWLIGKIRELRAQRDAALELCQAARVASSAPMWSPVRGAQADFAFKIEAALGVQPEPAEPGRGRNFRVPDVGSLPGAAPVPPGDRPPRRTRSTRGGLMTQRTYVETECDGCAYVERREQSTPFMPPAWRTVQIGYYGSNSRLVPERTALLCSKCIAKVARLLGAAEPDAVPVGGEC